MYMISFCFIVICSGYTFSAVREHVTEDNAIGPVQEGNTVGTMNKTDRMNTVEVGAMDKTTSDSEISVDDTDNINKMDVSCTRPSDCNIVTHYYNGNEQRLGVCMPIHAPSPKKPKDPVTPGGEGAGTSPIGPTDACGGCPEGFHCDTRRAERGGTPSCDPY